MFFVLPPIRIRNLVTVIERAQVFTSSKQIQYSTLTGNYYCEPSSCFKRELLASKCSSLYHQSGQKVFFRYRALSGFTILKPDPTFNYEMKLWREPGNCIAWELLASDRSSFYTVIARAHVCTLKTKFAALLLQKIRGGNQVLSSKENY